MQYGNGGLNTHPKARERDEEPLKALVQLAGHLHSWPLNDLLQHSEVSVSYNFICPLFLECSLGSQQVTSPAWRQLLGQPWGSHAHSYKLCQRQREKTKEYELSLSREVLCRGLGMGKTREFYKNQLYCM